MTEETRFIKINNEETKFVATYRHLVQNYEGNIGWYDDVTNEFCPIETDADLMTMRIVEYRALVWLPDPVWRDVPRTLVLDSYPTVEVAEEHIRDQYRRCKDIGYAEIRKYNGSTNEGAVRTFTKEELEEHE